MIKQTHLQRLKGKTYKYGIKVLFSYACTLAINKESNTTLWTEAITWELDKINSQNTYTSMGKQVDGATPLKG